MELHQIRYFLAVCDTLNFTRAAERCNVSQPALTRAIQKLEEEVGGLLFRREGKLTHLTDLGRLVLPHLQEVLQQTEHARSTAFNFLKLSNASLTVGVMCTIGPLRFVSVLNQFRLENPGIELTLMEAVPVRLSEMLMEGELDIAIMAQPGPLDPRLDARALYEERFVVAFPIGHRFSDKNAIEIDEVAGENYLLRVNCEYRDFLRETCNARGFETRKVYSSEREDWIQTMVAAGLGICFIPEYSVTHPGVQTRPIIDPEVRRQVSLLTVSGRRFSPPVAAFAKTVRSHAWELSTPRAGVGKMPA